MRISGARVTFLADTISSGERSRWKRPPRAIAPRTILVAAVALVAIEAVQDESRLQIISPPNGTVTDTNAVTVVGSVRNRNADYVQLSVNGAPRLVRVIDGVFQTRVDQLAPGTNAIGVSLGRMNTELVGVVCPRLAYHFNNDNHGWRVIGSGREQPEIPRHHTEGGVGGGYLAADDRAGHAHLDVIIVCDTTNSMIESIGSVKTNTRKIIAQVGENCESMRLGLVSFRDFAISSETAVESWPLAEEIEQQLTVMGNWGTGTGGATDYPEDQYLGLMKAFDLFKDDEEEGRQRLVILITDAAAKDPDKDGNTLASIIAHANDLRVPIFSIVVRNRFRPDDYEGVLKHSESLAEKTGGGVLKVVDPKMVADQLAQPIQVASQAAELNFPWMWQAPSECVDALRAAYGETVHVSLKQSGAGSPIDAPDVVLTGGGTSLILALDSPPDQDWSHYRFWLHESERWMHSISGHEISSEEFGRVLASLQNFEIRGEYCTGPDSGGLDRVIITSAR